MRCRTGDFAGCQRLNRRQANMYVASCQILPKKDVMNAELVDLGEKMGAEPSSWSDQPLVY
jgi:hypothetical protein